MRPIGRELLIRADAGIRMGTGHVMRCLALAQAWQDTGGRARFLMAGPPCGLEGRLRAEGIEVDHIAAEPGSDEDAEELVRRAAQFDTAWIVSDGYQFGSGYQHHLKEAGLRLLTVDDYGHANSYAAAFVLNQNLHARADLYPERSPNTRLLLGPAYVLLRREFTGWRGWKRDVPPLARKVLVTLGGSDPDNVTALVLQAVGQLLSDGVEAVAVAGASNPHLSTLEELAARHASRIKIRTNVANMAELMAWADVAVSAAGTTSWERALLGLPSLVVVLADNQREVATALEESGLGRILGARVPLSAANIASSLKDLMSDPQTRSQMARRGSEVVDGRGAERVVALLRGEMVLRPASRDDCRQVWEWANEPAVRAVSFSTDLIPWEHHQDWFAARLADSDCVFLMALGPGAEPLGQVRFDLRGNEAVISVSLDSRFRGRGYGQEVLGRAVTEMFGRGVKCVHAYVREGNEPSMRAFTRAGFTEVDLTMIQGHPARHLIRFEARA